MQMALCGEEVQKFDEVTLSVYQETQQIALWYTILSKYNYSAYSLSPRMYVKFYHRVQH